MIEEVILVDSNDQILGTCEKLKAHQEGLLHRAISVFIFNEKEEILLQQRAAHKYHSPKLWTNTCCSHPKLHESYEKAAYRRLKEEMGLETELQYAFHFIYKKEVGMGLIEHELDHVFIGKTSQQPILNPIEAMNYKWLSVNELVIDIRQNSEQYTIWFQIILQQYINHLIKK